MQEGGHRLLHERFGQENFDYLVVSSAGGDIDSYRTNDSIILGTREVLVYEV
jgi:hypothetical protein